MNTLAVQMGDEPQTVVSRSGDGHFHPAWRLPAKTSRTEVAPATISGPLVLVPTTEPLESSAVVDERIRQQVPLVGILVADRLRTVPSHVTRDDLVSAGMTALVLSARAFDPTLGVPFPVFASFRIRGALLDELRSMDWTSRKVRARARDIDTISAELTAALSRPPRIDEIATAMGLSIDEVERVRADLARGHVVSLQSFTTDSLPAHADGRAPCPETLILQRGTAGVSARRDRRPARTSATRRGRVLLPAAPDDGHRRRIVGDPVAGIADVHGGSGAAARRDELPAGPGRPTGTREHRTGCGRPPRLLPGDGGAQHRGRPAGDVRRARRHAGRHQCSWMFLRVELRMFGTAFHF